MIYNFLRRQCFHNVTERKKEGSVGLTKIVTERLEMKKALGKHNFLVSPTLMKPPMYGTLPRSTIKDKDKPVLYELDRDILTVVLTVYADGQKASMAIIGTVTKPQSFPRHVDVARELGCFIRRNTVLGTHRLCRLRCLMSSTKEDIYKEENPPLSYKTALPISSLTTNSIFFLLLSYRPGWHVSYNRSMRLTDGRFNVCSIVVSCRIF